MTITRNLISTMSVSDTVVNGVNQSTATFNVPIGGSRTGTKVGNWKKKIANRENATSTMIGNDLTCDQLQSCHYVSPQRNPANIADGAELQYLGNRRFCNVAPVDESQVASCENAARAKAYSSLSSGFNGHTVLGELKQTIEMIKHPAQGLRKAVALLKTDHKTIRDKFRKAAGYRRAIADSWLEARFGWEPLLMDIDSACDAYNMQKQAIDGTSFKETFRLRSKTPEVLYANVPVIDAIWQSMYLSTSTDTSISYTGFAKLSKSYPPVSSIYGVGFPSFVPAAWELLPWSFLIDYFTNIGDILDSWATAQYTSFSYSCYTKRVVTTTTNRSVGGLVPQSPYPRRFTTKEEGIGVWSNKMLLRQPGTAVPLPSLQATVKLSAGHGLNIAALIAGRGSDAKFRK